MSNERQLTTKDFFKREGVKHKFEEMLGKRAPGYITSVLQVVNSNNYLASATPESVYSSAAMAATLDLPINNSLGFAWIVPYNTNVQVDGKWVKRVMAQLQIGWKGFVQLAQRSGQYTRINVAEVYENQFVSYNRLTETLNANFDIEGAGSIVGYVAYFRLINGFEKLVFWSKEKVVSHAKRYSQSYGKKGTPWADNFDEMAMKTVLKNTLSKWGILSIEMQQATVYDQAAAEWSATEDGEAEVFYPDNQEDDTAEVAQIDKPEFTELHFDMAYDAGATIETIRNGYTTTAEIEQQYNEWKVQRESQELETIQQNNKK